ncbi:MAG TPA: C-GCAxxG-C-C family protein [Candidatus Bathyarchaeia archaeon]|nr:C-GCAxxG-C-C family protein [Candidatus Bathyarchaeia archaeon]
MIIELTDLAVRLGEKATKHFAEGYNCAQSVLLTMAEHWKWQDELIPKVACTFGGGMGRCGSVCGAVTGGLMAIGIKCGTNEPPSKSAEKSTHAYKLAETFFRQFQKQNGSVTCRDLIGLDLSDPTQLKKARDERVFDKECSPLLKSAIEILISLDLDTV